MSVAQPRPLAALLFDLDGTLVDTAPDLINTLNRLRSEHKLPAMAEDALRHHVSNGALALLQAGFDLPADDPAMDSLRQRFLAMYAANISEHSQLYPGMAPLLEQLEQQQRPWGIITNKPGYLTEPLVEALELHHRAAVVISGDSLARNKPDPLQLTTACERMALPSADIMYIGDAERDIEAGRAAGMLTCVARFGYIGPEDQPEQWGADLMIDHAEELKAWI